MIVPMKKIFVVARANDREKFLETLRDAGVLHLVPANPDAGPDEDTARKVQLVDNALLALESVEPSGEKPDTTAERAAEEAAAIARRNTENKNRLNTLAREIDNLEIWGNTRLEQLRRLNDACIDVRFFSVKTGQVEECHGDCIEQLGHMDKKHVLVAVASGGGAWEIPESAVEIEKPGRDRPSLQQEAKEIEQHLLADKKRLTELAHLLPEIRREAATAKSTMIFSTARNGGMANGQLYAVQGWIPEGSDQQVMSSLSDAGIPAALEEMLPDEDEKPPTLIRHPGWVKPIQALFDVLGTKPGYREYDLSAFFMVAMPIFAAMLIGDAGYGLVFILTGAIFYGKLKKKAGPEAPRLIIIFGLATMAWGILTANWFGIAPPTAEMIQKGAEVNAFHRFEMSLGLFWRENEEASRNLVMQICFIIACIHLVLAHLRKVIDFLPSMKGLAEIGWCSFLAGMFAVVWVMLFTEPVFPLPMMYTLLGAGTALVVLFSYPEKNPVKRLALGIMGNLMDLISTFSDTMSYIRLMAVGLASYYIASAFNGLAGRIVEASDLLIPAAAIMLLMAHALNILLCIIAIFAHGVRLNMLEFSNNAGVQWAGYAYRPFTKHDVLD